MEIDVQVMELLASKLCHDLISPVSAINNGVELIEDIGGSVVEEAMKLIGDSANHAARRLKLFRMAYGRAGNEGGLPLREVRTVAEQYIAGGKVTLTWPQDQPIEVLASQHGFLKVVLNVLILAEELLPYGGAVSIKPAVVEDVQGCRFEIVGRNAQFSPPILAAFQGTVLVDDLTPRSIQAYVTGRFAEHFNLKLSHDQSITDRLDITLYGIAAAPAVDVAVPTVDIAAPAVE